MALSPMRIFGAIKNHQALKNPPERVLCYQDHSNILSAALLANGRSSLISEALPALQLMDPIYAFALEVYMETLRNGV